MISLGLLLNCRACLYRTQQFVGTRTKPGQVAAATHRPVEQEHLVVEVDLANRVHLLGLRLGLARLPGLVRLVLALVVDPRGRLDDDVHREPVHQVERGLELLRVAHKRFRRGLGLVAVHLRQTRHRAAGRVRLDVLRLDESGELVEVVQETGRNQSLDSGAPRLDRVSRWEFHVHQPVVQLHAQAVLLVAVPALTGHPSAPSVELLRFRVVYAGSGPMIATVSVVRVPPWTSVILPVLSRNRLVFGICETSSVLASIEPAALVTWSANPAAAPEP